MSLEVTQEEFDRLDAHRIFRVSYRIPYSIETQILNLVHIGDSTREICRELHVSIDTVNRVKKQNNLWGV
jgi:ATP/maltotriose-dependent transcriptional regulator MalT